MLLPGQETPGRLPLGRKTGPFRFTLSPGKTEYQADETIRLASVLRNESEQKLALSMTPRVSFYGMDVRLPGPAWMPFRDRAVLSPEGERRVYPGHTSAAGYVLNPGQELADEFEINRLYVMTVPGEYHITFYFRAPDNVGKGVMVMSNEIVVTVAEKK
jgi:hypothetical protein